ncbi:MAG: helix-turn-helix transcriptional regulator [Flavobacteriales bacterium]|nr:helix-turn-helix transcriptional regulator [Flavobacteriales bacterium]
MFNKQELSEKIGKRIKQIRKEKGISQSELGWLCQKDKQHIELIENNKVSPNVYTLYQIACALEIELSFLLKID